MAAMIPADRVKCGAQWMRDNLESIGIDRAALQSAINATDDWIDANATSFNAALPLPARTALSAAQKQRLFMYVLSMRNGALPIEGG